MNVCLFACCVLDNCILLCMYHVCNVGTLVYAYTYVYVHTYQYSVAAVAAAAAVVTVVRGRR